MHTLQQVLSQRQGMATETSTQESQCSKRLLRRTNFAGVLSHASLTRLQKVLIFSYRASKRTKGTVVCYVYMAIDSRQNENNDLAA